MSELIIDGDEVTDTDELAEGDRVTVIADGSIEVEDVGTAYKIPDVEVTNGPVVKVEDAEILDVDTMFGAVSIRIEGISSSSALPNWINGHNTTVYKVA